MNSVKHFCAVLLLFGAGSPSWPQSATEERLHKLLTEARHATRPQPWAKLLIDADSEAVKLERKEPCSCGDIRSVKAEHSAFSSTGGTSCSEARTTTTICYARLFEYSGALRPVQMRWSPC